MARPRARLPGERPGPAGRSPIPALLAQLKAWRTAEARRKSMPPYVIFHDRTLAELAAARPRDLQGLRQVPGSDRPSSRRTAPRCSRSWEKAEKSLAPCTG